MLYCGVRFEKLSKLVANDPDLESKNKNPLAAIEDEKAEHAQKMERMEAEMGAVLETKVGERRGVMEEGTRREEEAVTRERAMVDRAREEIRDKRGELERERVEWTTRCEIIIIIIKSVLLYLTDICHFQDETEQRQVHRVSGQEESFPPECGHIQVWQTVSHDHMNNLLLALNGDL